MKSIRIGTRNSPLALWQAHEVERRLQRLGCQTEIVPILASGDKNLAQPLYALGITGIFTRDLDVALLNNDIDIAVHSLKDVPTTLPQGLEIMAYLPRDYPQDVLVRNPAAAGKPFHELKIATSSLRRRAFWLKEYPGTEFTDIRGNVNTRLAKLDGGLADATIFSLAGLKRLNLAIPYEALHFMIPAPSQGVVSVTGRTDSQGLSLFLDKINCRETQHCVEAERSFLSTLEGGCTAPIGAFAEILGGKMRFQARLCSINGKDCIETDEIINYIDENPGRKIAESVLENGGKAIMEDINAQLRDV